MNFYSFDKVSVVFVQISDSHDLRTFFPYIAPSSSIVSVTGFYCPPFFLISMMNPLEMYIDE